MKEQGYIPDFSDEQAVWDAAFQFRRNYQTHTFPFGALRRLFEPSKEAFDLTSDATVLEAESAKYDAVRDFILMLAVRKAQTSATQQQQGSHDSDATVKEEGA